MAVRYDRNSPIALFYLGRCRQKLGRKAAAVEALTEALRIEPDLVQARVTLGMTLNALGRPRDAIAELERAAKALPDEGKVHYQLGIAYDALADKSRARECYRRARTCAS
jgi:tetratricopeptide (TPR) repeat protein